MTTLREAIKEVPHLEQLGEAGRSLYALTLNVQRAALMQMLKEHRNGMVELNKLDDFLRSQQDFGTW